MNANHANRPSAGTGTPAEAAHVGARIGLLIAIVLLLGDLLSGVVQGDPFLSSTGRTRWIVERIFLLDSSVMGGVVFAEMAAALRRWRPRSVDR